MERTIGSIFGISKQTEVLIMTVLALWSNIFDMAIFDLSSNLDQVWSANMDAAKFPEGTQHTIKMILSSVVLIQTFSLHIYIAFLIVMFWPASFATRPTLMLPWLLVSFIKNLVTGFITLAMGMFTCYTYGAMRPACVQFVASEFIDYAPSLYMWLVGISYYRDLKKPKRIIKTIPKHSKDTDFDLAVRRRKVKSMADENILRNQIEARRKYFGTSAVIVDEIYKISPWDNIGRVMSRSLDSLLDALAVEAEFLDLEDFEEIEEGLTVPERTAKLLGITQSEISRTIQNKQALIELPIYPINLQKKCTLLSERMRNESRFKSSFIVNTLLTGTTLYNPTNKPIRPTKSELKCSKDFLQIKTPTEFIKTLSDREVNFYNFDKKTDTNTIFLSDNTTNGESVTSHNISNLVIMENTSNTLITESRDQLHETLKSGVISGKTRISKLPVWAREHSDEDSKKNVHLQETIITKTDYGKVIVEGTIENCSEDCKSDSESVVELKHNISEVNANTEKHKDNEKNNKIKCLRADVTALFDKIADDKVITKVPVIVAEDNVVNDKKVKFEKRKQASARFDKGYKTLYKTKGLQVYPKKYSDSGVQASTLSRKVLEVPAKEMSLKLAVPRSMDLLISSKTLTPKSGESFKLSMPNAMDTKGLSKNSALQPNTRESFKLPIPYTVKTKVSSKSSTLYPKSGETTPKSSPRTRENSYVEIHWKRFEMEKYVTYKRKLVEDGYSRMYKESHNLQAERRIPDAQLE